MAARSIGSLTLSFGLVAIPVKIFPATQSGNAITFNLLHKGCGSRLGQQYVCVKHGTVVERDDIVKGYEFAKDQYVTFTPEEIKALEEAGTHAVDIAEFVPVESIDPVFFDKSYYLAPDKGAAKPYSLLTEALKETARCAVGRWASHGRDHVVVLRPIGNVLTMQQLFFAADVRAVEELEVPKPDVKPAELKLARQLIEQHSADHYDPSSYADELRARIQAEIDKKVQGKQISVAEAAVPEVGGGKVINLMDALRASLEKTEAARASTARLDSRKGPRRAEQALRPARKAGRRTAH